MGGMANLFYDEQKQDLRKYALCLQDEHQCSF